jgi:predicted outer membrane repeat protein
MKRILTLLASLSLVAGFFAATPAATVAASWLNTNPEWVVALRDPQPNTSNGTCSNPDFTSIQDAINASIDEDTIHICKGTYKITDTLDVENTTGLTFEGDGASKTVIDGTLLSVGDYLLDNGILHGNVGEFAADISVANIAFKNGRGTAGAAISANEVSCYASTFLSNHADEIGDFTSGIGGAIYADGDVTLDHCTFRNNSAQGSGGAIYAGGNVIDSGSVYTLNSANVGGAVYAEADRGAEEGSSFNASTFSKNWADSYGGAIFSDNAGLSVNASTFTGNGTDQLGGAIYKECQLVDVTTGYDADQSYAPLSNLYLDLCDFTVSSSTFTGNNAGVSGGAIMNADENSILSVTSSNFKLNSVPREDDQSNGGAIFSAGWLSANGSSFSRNTAGGVGGAIYSKYSRRACLGVLGTGVGDTRGWYLLTLGIAERADYSGNTYSKNKAYSGTSNAYTDTIDSLGTVSPYLFLDCRGYDPEHFGW